MLYAIFLTIGAVWLVILMASVAFIMLEKVVSIMDRSHGREG